MELKDLIITAPNGQQFKVDGTVEHNPKYGFKLVQITKVNGKKVKDNYVLKDLVSHEQIELHVKKK